MFHLKKINPFSLFAEGVKWKLIVYVSFNLSHIYRSTQNKFYVKFTFNWNNLIRLHYTTRMFHQRRLSEINKTTKSVHHKTQLNIMSESNWKICYFFWRFVELFTHLTHHLSNVTMYLCYIHILYLIFLASLYKVDLGTP